MTLIETLVATVLLSLVTGLISTFLIYFLRQAARYNARQESMTQCERCLARLQSELGDARASLVTADTTIAGIYFPVASGSTGDALKFTSAGELSWQGWSAFGWDSKTLKVWEANQVWNSADVAGKAPSVAISSWRRIPLVQNVREFGVTGPVANVFRVRILVRDESGFEVEIATSAEARN